jgi:TRAP-type C4-dicarboxylate transport system permease small subunit
MVTPFRKHKHFWAQKPFVSSTLLGVFFLVISLAVLYFANFYTTLNASNYVTDFILDKIPTVNVGFLFSEGALLFFALLLIINILEPRHIPFVLKASAMFIVVRSFFLILTHVGPPLNMLQLNPADLFFKLSSGDDLFFSSHTGYPLLMALIFWDEKYLRYFFIFSTIVGAAIVLLGHLHYSIDVFAALFIAFGVFHLAKEIFSKDFLFFNPK